MKGLTKKLNRFSQDILSLLEEYEPKMLMWREIRNLLWSKYQAKYPKSGKKGFGSALSNKLTLLEVAGLVKHEDDFYGTSKAAIIKKSEQTHPVVDQKQVEKAIKELKSQLTRSPFWNEVARELVVDPEDSQVRAVYYRVMKKLGLKEPSKEDVLESQLPFLGDI